MQALWSGHSSLPYTLQATVWLKPISKGAALSMSRCWGSLSHMPSLRLAHQGRSACVICIQTRLGLPFAHARRISHSHQELRQDKPKQGCACSQVADLTELLRKKLNIDAMPGGMFGGMGGGGGGAPAAGTHHAVAMLKSAEQVQGWIPLHQPSALLQLVWALHGGIPGSPC